MSFSHGAVATIALWKSAPMHVMTCSLGCDYELSNRYSYTTLSKIHLVSNFVKMSIDFTARRYASAVYAMAPVSIGHKSVF